MEFPISANTFGEYLVQEFGLWNAFFLDSQKQMVVRQSTDPFTAIATGRFLIEYHISVNKSFRISLYHCHIILFVSLAFSVDTGKGNVVKNGRPTEVHIASIHQRHKQAAVDNQMQHD